MSMVITVPFGTSVEKGIEKFFERNYLQMSFSFSFISLFS